MAFRSPFDRLREAYEATKTFLRREVVERGREALNFIKGRIYEEGVGRFEPGEATAPGDPFGEVINAFREDYRGTIHYKNATRYSVQMTAPPEQYQIGPDEQITYHAYLLTPEGKFLHLSGGLSNGEQWTEDRFKRKLAAGVKEKLPDEGEGASGKVLNWLLDVDYFVSRVVHINRTSQPLQV